jgi:myotubularin-related protein 6/7/8
MGAIPDRPDRPTRSNAWRWSSVNAGYDFCSTYPAQLAVPAKISDVTLKYGKPYRSKHRIPALVYLHWANLVSFASTTFVVRLKSLGRAP